VRRVVLAALLAALVLPAAALGAGEIKHASAARFPHVELTVVAPSSSQTPPTLLENGRPVAGLEATNLGSSKSVVVCIDRSQSMTGKPIVDAAASARAFAAAKSPSDRIAVCTFGSEAEILTRFSTSTIDADAALRTMGVDSVRGTALYDAIVQSSHLLGGEQNQARVLIILSDGVDFVEGGDSVTLDDAIQAAKNAGVAVYTIGIEGSGFDPEALQQISDVTNGSYYGAATSAALRDVYTSIAEDLRRTWHLEYVTAARPGDHLELTVGLPGGDQLTTPLTAPGVAPPPAEGPSPLLPDFFYTSDWGLPVLAGVVGLLALIAAAFALAAPKGTWLRGRLDPHVASTRTKALKQEREGKRLALFAGLFRATESVFGNLKQWRKIDTLLQRADIPLKTPEFAYIMLGFGLVFAFLSTALVRSPFAMVIGFGIGVLIPCGFLSMKARKRLKAFDEQLPDMLVTMAASLKAGHSFRQGIQSVVDEGVDPAAKEFKRVLNETRLGRPMDDALTDMASRVGSDNFEFVMSAVTIQRQVGGSLAGLFDMVADTVRQRQQFRRKIRGLTAMGRMSAYTLIGLPFVVGLAIYAINRDYMKPLLTTSTGHKLLILMFVMMGIGSLMLKKIVSFKG
jgi:tight adherence protein B